MRARCWNLRFNLDTFNAAVASLDTDAERAEFLVGLSRGANGGKVKGDCPDPMSVGFALGAEMRLEAESFREKSAENGSKRKSNRNDHTVYQKVDLMVDQDGTQSTIHNPQSTNLNPEPALPVAPKRARKQEPPDPPEHLLPKLTTIAKDWPRRSDYNGSKADVSVLVRPSHIWARIQRFVPEADWELALNCGLVYLDELDKRERGVGDLIPNVCAMTNFWGEAGLWKKMVVKVDELVTK